MITRPLQLASRLRPAPPHFDALFYVNVGLLALFFTVFGSPFVLGPSIGLDFQLPQVAGASLNRLPFTHHITVVKAGQIFAGGGQRDMADLREWLMAQGKTVKQPSLLIVADARVPLSVAADITGMAKAAGFVHVQSSATEPSAGSRPPALK